MKDQYDSSWDLKKGVNGNMPNDMKAFDRIYDEWRKRSWLPWLESKLSFPFEVERKEDDDDVFFSEKARMKPFRLGHKMNVTGIELENHYGIIVWVQEGENIGQVPLCDVEVTSRDNKNFWPVREYAVWFANK